MNRAEALREAGGKGPGRSGNSPSTWMRPRPLVERFSEKVTIAGPDECWVWTGGQGQDGHGRFFVNGKLRPAAQIAWEIENGRPFPAGMDACHSCDNPPCVNPAHIWPGTASQNVKDSYEKGRRPSKRSHCPSGHEMTEANTYRSPGGSPECRSCRSIRSRVRHERQMRERNNEK